jgi:hypothetical protein
MGFRYRKSFRLARGTRLNLTGRGISSVSIGRRGSTINFGQKGVRGTVGVPGSGLSYSSRLTSGVLPALVIAILAGILVAAASGHRLAKVAIVVILIPCVMFMLTHHATEQTEALSIKTIAQDRPQIEAIRSPLSPAAAPALPTAAAGAPKPLEPNASGTISDWSTDPVADVKPVGPMDTKTGSAEHTPKSSDNRVVQADNLSNHIALLNLTQAPDALRVQRRLLSLGYRVGMPDGIWGVMSQVAIDEFRRKHRLSGKAKWDEETQAALFSEINLESGSDLEIEQTEATPKASSLGDKH